MLKLRYLTIIMAVVFAASCKKETVNPTPPTPVDTTTNAQAVFSLLDSFGNCNPIRIEGSYFAGTPLTQNNRVVLQVKVTKKGKYSLSLTTGNGYVFAATGSFIATGEQLLILPGSGAPYASKIDNFSITNQGVTCSFSITVLSPAAAVYDDNDHMYFGNPNNAATITDSAANYLLRKPYYALSYNSNRGIPNWVSWHLYSADIGTISRQDDFRPDDLLPVGWYQVTVPSYSNSGFDKGHNCPSADRTSTAEANSSTFILTNIIPQAPQNNQIVWSRMEDSLRRLTTFGYELYIIMGNYGEGGTGNNGFATTIDNGKVTVPAHIWKVAVIIPNGNNDSSRVDINTRVIAVDIPNSNSVSGNWKDYRVSVDAIEAATGYNLLTRLPESLQADLESRVDGL